MSASPPPRSEAQLKQSDELKQKGNAAFGKKDFTAAYSLYTEAISLNPSSQALYSNRSAALLSLKKLPLALNDANKAIELDPKWSKAYRRKASVLDAMKHYEEAIDVYSTSLKVGLVEAGENGSAQEKVQAEVKKLIEAIEKKIGNDATCGGVFLDAADARDLPGPLVVREAERRMASGEPIGRWPPIGSCLRRIWIAEMQFGNAMSHLHEFHKGQIPGAPAGVMGIFGRVQTLEEITTAILEDIRVARFTAESLEKISLCYALEQQQRNAIGPNLSPKATIEQYKERLTQPPRANQHSIGPTTGGNNIGGGWDSVRPALQLSIRTALLNGCLAMVDSSGGEKHLQRAVDLIECARDTWPDIDGSIRGRSLEETFLRGAKVLHGEALLAAFLSSPPATEAAKRKALADIISIGDWLVSSFHNNPSPPEEEKQRGPAGEDGWWGIYYTHYVAPLAKGHTLRAFGNLQLALGVDKVNLDSSTGKKGPTTGDPAKLGITAKEYATAAAWMSPDDPLRASAMWHAIFALVLRGGYYITDLHLLREISLQAPTFFTPYFKPSAISATHPGKPQSQEVLSSTQNAPHDTICSPLVKWEDDVEFDEELLNEVMMPYLRITLHSGKKEDGWGMLTLCEVLRGVWKYRVEVMRERPAAVGAEDIWGALDRSKKVDWEKCLERLKAEEGGDIKHADKNDGR